MNRLSLAPVTINEIDPPELIAAAAEAEFDSVDLRVLGAPGAAPVTALIGNRPLIAAIAAACADTGVTIFAATGIWLVPDFSLEAVLPALEIAARLGAEQFLVVGNDPEEGRMAANLAALAEAAGQAQLRLALELMPYTAVNSVAKAAGLIQRSGADLGLVVDALHLARSGGRPADIAALDRHFIGYLQLCDAPATLPPGQTLRQESLNSRLYPGQGELPLLALLDALPANIVIDVETPVAEDRHLPPEERAKRALAATRRLLNLWGGQK